MNLLWLALIVTASSWMTAAAPGQLAGVPAPMPAPFMVDTGEELILSVENPPLVIVADMATGKVKRTLSLQQWQPSGAGRPIAVDREGHLFVVDVATNSIAVFDRRNSLLRTFTVDLTCAGNPAGSGLRDMAFTSQGTLVILGGWNSGTINYLLELDPETGSTIHCCNLNTTAGFTFEGARIALDATGLVYVTQYSPTQGPKAVGKFDVVTCSLVGLVATPAADTNLVDIEVLPSGALVLGDTWNATVWMSDAGQSTWCALATCSTAPGDHQSFTVAHGRLYANGATNCGNPAPGIDVIPLACDGTTSEHLVFAVPSITAIVARHR